MRHDQVAVSTELVCVNGRRTLAEAFLTQRHEFRWFVFELPQTIEHKFSFSEGKLTALPLPEGVTFPTGATSVRVWLLPINKDGSARQRLPEIVPPPREED